jgi:hypothetical protein
VKALLVVTDSEAVPVFERALAEKHEGFTVLPAVVGSGRSGLRAGDRVHPGSSSLVFTVMTEGEEARTLAALRQARDAAGYADRTRMWSFDVEAAD